MLLFIKFFSIILTSTYIYKRLLNLSNKVQYHFISVLFSFLLTTITVVINQLFPHTVIVFLIAGLAFYLFALYKTEGEPTLATTIIAYGISHSLFMLAGLIVSVITAILISYVSYDHLVTQLITCALHIFMTPLVFLPKRLRKGMPFLTNHSNSNIPLIISLLILYTVFIMSNTDANTLFVTMFFITFIFSILIYMYWRNSITRTYMDKSRERDFHDLNASLDTQEKQLQKVVADKEELSKIIHRDNKLVPAMLLAVESYLTEFPDASDRMTARGKELMAELQVMAQDRKGLLAEQDKRCMEKLVATGFPALDTVLSYMAEKAHLQNMELSVSADADIAELIKGNIAEEDLKTLVADLIDNAIIANSYCNGQRLLFSIGRVDKYFLISIFDTGIPFTKEVLADLGIVEHTTHKDAGGSGIGLMTIFELVRKYRASLIIEEFNAESALYTKRIKIQFDKRAKYILNTSRPKDEIFYLKQRPDLIIMEK